MNKITRAACYCRVSTDKQVDKGLSLDDQKAELKKYCIENNFTIVDFYIDGGVSGGKLNRPELNRMLEDVENDLIDIVLFTHIDRFGRSSKNYYLLENILEKHNVTWEAVCEHHDINSAAGNLSFSVIQAAAEFLRRQTAEKVTNTFRAKKERGEPCNGSAVLGYMIKDKRMIPNPKTVPIVQEMFDYYEKHGHLYNTNQMMRDKYYPNTNIETTGRRLRNPMYIGIYNRGGVLNENYCEPIITKEQFYRVQYILKKNTKKKINKEKTYIFSKMLKCGRCGYNFKGDNTRYKTKNGNAITYYYNCYGTYFKKECNANFSINEKKIEQMLLNIIEEKLKRSKIEVIVDTNEDEDKDKIKNEILSINKKLDKLKNLYLNDMVLLDQYNNDFTAFKARLEELNEKLEQKPIKQETEREKLQKIVESGILNNYDTFTREERRRLWLSIIDHIVVYERDYIEPIFK